MVVQEVLHHLDLMVELEEAQLVALVKHLLVQLPGEELNQLEVQLVLVVLVVTLVLLYKVVQIHLTHQEVLLSVVVDLVVEMVLHLLLEEVVVATSEVVLVETLEVEVVLLM